MAESVAQLVGALAAGGTGRSRAAAQLMTLLQDRPERLTELLAAAPSLSEPAWIVGITGAPGVGKSTLASALVGRLRGREEDAPIGIVAIDPSSRGSGGAILGDRVRMMQHAGDANVFIRSLSSRGRMGGLTRGLVAVLAVLRLLECRYVIVETVGVGQSEIDVRDAVDLVALVLAPGHGDSIQLLKSGVIEIADLVIVNQSDRPEAAELHARVVQHLHDASDSRRDMPREALLASAVGGTGVDAVLEQLDVVAAKLRDPWIGQRAARIEQELRSLLVERVVDRVRARADATGAVGAAVDRLRSGRTSLEEEVTTLLGALVAGGTSRGSRVVEETADA